MSVSRRVGPAATSLPDAGTRAALAAIHTAASRSGTRRRKTTLDSSSALGLTGRRLSAFVAQCGSDIKDQRA
ncbi:hypothetical protein LDENG_00010800 [Lucifuga dentata]|nr:hypothetical protein LDENG_00010800 [Lucifuga dentata]